MHVSELIQGSHTTVSPVGQYVASVCSSGRLRISAFNAPAQRYSEISIRIQLKDITHLRWNQTGGSIAVISAKHIEVINLDDASHRVRIDNGSAGFGRFSHAVFISEHGFLVFWEFGHVKYWDYQTGKGFDVSEVKSGCDGTACVLRPTGEHTVLAVLSRQGADDVLNLYLAPSEGLQHFRAIRLPTQDAQSLTWSPDGRWLAVLDVATASTGVHFLTPDGNLFRSYPSSQEEISLGLGVKAVVWSADSATIALTRYDGRIVLLNTRTFAPRAVIEHTPTIHQRSAGRPDHQASIFQESVSACGDRAYNSVSQPFSPPISRTKPTTEPSELGTAEACFSCDANWLATRDERMLNTIWVWDMASLGAHAVLVQHNNVRKLHWHSTKPDQLLIDCGEGIAYIYKPRMNTPPVPTRFDPASSARLSWLHCKSHAQSAILAITRISYKLLYPEGRPDDVEVMSGAEQDVTGLLFDEGASEDSLFDVLSGRKPLPPKTEQSYTERVDLEVRTEEDGSSVRLDDTFREKRPRQVVDEVDPLDDSDIF